MLIEYMFIAMCVLFSDFWEAAFLCAASRDTRLSAWLVKKKKGNLGGHFPYWWEETHMGCLLANCECVWVPSAGTRARAERIQVLSASPAPSARTRQHTRGRQTKGSRWLSLESQGCHFLCPEKWSDCMCLQSACHRPHLPQPEEEHSVETPGPMLNHKQLRDVLNGPA